MRRSRSPALAAASPLLNVRPALSYSSMALRLLPDLLVELGRRLELLRLLVARRRPVLEPGADVDASRRRVALAGLVGARGLGQHAHRLEELGGAQVVLPLLEERGRLGHAVRLEGHLAAQGRGPHDVAGLLEGLRRAARGPRRA